MAGATLSQVLERFDTDAEETLILVALIHRREENSRDSWTKIPASQLVTLTRLSESSVRRRLRDLARRGILQVKTDKGRNGNRYKIHAEKQWLKEKPRQDAEASDTTE